jgi:ABC-type Fe3+ transport system substrate-binding protein
MAGDHYRVLALALAASCVAGRAWAIDPAVIEAAKKEGQVVWYSTQIISQLVRPVAAAFEKKYPGIKVLSTRANASEVAVKILNESHAGKVQVDVFDGTSTVVPLEKEGYVLQWQPEAAKAYPAIYRDPAGYWVASNLYINTPGYNTSLVPKGMQPMTYQDLLDPKWRGKMAWDGLPATSGGDGFIGTVLAEMGEEKGMAYLRALSKRKIANVASSAREVLDEVIAGEYPIALQIFAHHPLISAGKGAPVTSQLLPPVASAAATVVIPKGVRHPYAAMLLMDFLLSSDGQKILAASEYLPVRADVDPLPQIAPIVPSRAGVAENFISPEKLEAYTESSSEIVEKLFR